MKKYLALLLLALTFVCLLAFSVSAAETFVNPVANGADPFVFKDTDGTYYLYVTSGGSYGYRVYSSTNLVEWEAQGYCLRRDDVYVDETVLNDAGTAVKYSFWAPEVMKQGDKYYMIYSCQEHLGIAVADSPLGPFKTYSDGYLFDDMAIDGHFFRDDDGKLYVYFVSVGSWNLNGDRVSRGNNIWGGPFNLETLSFESGYPRLFVPYDTYANNGFDGDAVAEGPEMLKHNGKYYLTYSASGYTDPEYAVHYATSTSPTGPFTKYSGNPVFITDDPNQRDTSGAHLYGTAHHCFTTSPDGKEMIIVYHAHRSGSDPNGTGGTVEERRICIDLAWFDSNGVLHAGRKTDGHPTATAQVLPSGGKLTRTQDLTGPFAEIPSLPTVYVAYTDGNDSAAGTKAAPFKTLDAAYAALPNGGTIVITQTYNASVGDHYIAPAVNGPIMIKGLLSATPLRFKFFSVNSDTYFENIAFWPETVNYISVIECNFNNVVMGDGVSCIAQPTRKTFPVLVGGKWATTKTGGVYDNYHFTSNADITSSEAFTLTVKSGTWSIATEKSVKDTATIKNTTPGGALVLEGDAKIRPAKASAPTVTASSEGAVVSFKAITYAPMYVIYKDGEVVGYTETTTFVDETWKPGDADASYSYAGYVNGACIGEAGEAATLSFVVDIDVDGDVDIADVVLLLKNILDGKTIASLVDVLIVFKAAVQ